jgi:cell division protease FtsH
LRDSRSDDGVVLLAATNWGKILDPCCYAPAAWTVRFSSAIDKQDRITMLKVHLKKAVLATDVDREDVAELTLGFTGAGSRR